MPARLLNLSYGFTLLWLLSMTLSIAVAEAAMWSAAAAWGIAWLLRELNARDLAAFGSSRGPAGDVLGVVGAPLIVFFALSLLSALISRDLDDVVTGLLELREIFLFAAPLVAWTQFRTLERRRTGQQVFAFGILIAVVWGIYQTLTGVPAEGDAMVRASGPLGHYMTFSGVLLVSIPLLLSLRGGIAGVAAKVVAVLAVTMIGLTLTRSAWIGCGVALLVYAATGFVGGATGGEGNGGGRQRAATYVIAALIGLTVVGLLLVALAPPEALYERAGSIFSLDDASNRDRLAMAATGLRIIEAYPLLGIGPGLMDAVYPAWKVDWGVNDDNQHLHNNILQIAAERGLLGLAAWLWMMGAFALVGWRVLRAGGAQALGGPEARAALAALAGFLAMGMFEYNFSDSEVLMALLYVISLPLAAAAGAADYSAAD